MSQPLSDDKNYPYQTDILVDDLLEHVAIVIEGTFGRAHTLASENADRYHIQNEAIAKAAKRVRALKGAYRIAAAPPTTTQSSTASKCCTTGQPCTVEPCARCPEHPVAEFHVWLDTYGPKAGYDRGDMAACWHAAQRALTATRTEVATLSKIASNLNGIANAMAASRYTATPDQLDYWMRSIEAAYDLARGATTVSPQRQTPHQCGDTSEGRICHMDLDGTCQKDTCTYYDQKQSPPQKEGSR